MSFTPLDLPQGIIQLITDELPSPADFILHQKLISHVKESKEGKRIILSVSEGWAKWQAIASKHNVNLAQEENSGSLTFVDISSFEPEESGLRQIFNVVVEALKECTPDSLVILDDVSTLEWIGVSTLDILRFCRALRAQCIKHQATLLIRHHLVVYGMPDQLFRDLMQLATYHVDVRPLASGRSGAVSGEVALHLGPNALPPASVKPIPRSRAVQYRLTDSGSIFFERGNSHGVL
ncbi:uncharacterized protein BT62DRAFT_964874 [Guyanagaster necrorhizus]|uniref:Elongator complex protein 5 n=1 Tax=Guyanagaster necrorhizus TaxID=856835 RepID=A0A9P7VYD1_9AGAR|nr:uncharacterized protein BT62DRAFT_964874 [Guyanagaster necrorhizus MCA 3950]KAG7448484.1 hypothetical protein BT62DRAFT_964874 [Guyanagaster necrorhizus MCA 3950]